MVCGNSAMEAITSISKATATQFSMQQVTNCSRPLPFPTVTEVAKLKDNYNMAAHRGRPSVPTHGDKGMGPSDPDPTLWLGTKPTQPSNKTLFRAAPGNSWIPRFARNRTLPALLICDAGPEGNL